MMQKVRVITYGGEALDCMIPATDADQQTFEKMRTNNWYKTDARKARNVDHHRKGFALINIIFDNQDRYQNMDDLLVELKLRAGWYHEHVRTIPTSKELEMLEEWLSVPPQHIDFKKIWQIIDRLKELEQLVLLPKSISFNEMDQLEFEQFYERLIDIALFDYDLEEALEFIGVNVDESKKRSNRTQQAGV